MAFDIWGQVRVLENRDGIGGLTVEAWDADLIGDDRLGAAETDADGRYRIRCVSSSGGVLGRDRPDVYLVVRGAGGHLLRSTRDRVVADVDRDLALDVEVPLSALAQAGLRQPEPAAWMADVDPAWLARFTTWTLGDEGAVDPAMSLIRDDLEGRASILALLCQYRTELTASGARDAAAWAKLATLFQLGVRPARLEGHFYGVPIGIRTDHANSSLSTIDALVGLVWGAGAGNEGPWVSKSFAAIDQEKAEAITLGSVGAAGSLSEGVNHFHRIECRPGNVAAFQFAGWWMDLEPATAAEEKAYGYQKTGAHFLTAVAPSVWRGSQREVLQLNYRWRNLANRPPLCWLIDEVVAIADGLYLGQLLFATRRLLRDHDPRRLVADWQYEHFGYFALWDEGWNPEARRLLPFLEMPVTAPGLGQPPGRISLRLPKFTTFTFERPAHPLCDAAVMARVQDDLSGRPTILHLLRDYAAALQRSADNESEYFARLRELFMRGIGLSELRGYYRGALVSWRTDGLLRFFDVNTVSLAWTTIGRHFSTWTGKSFEDISAARLQELTDGLENGTVPTFWGANTQALRTPRERFVGKMMELAQVWTEPVPADEALAFGYDVKNFFFIAHRAESVNRDNRGKSVLQINYRWPKLRTIPPDRYCIDELVQVADGLYLGQLMYATQLARPYEPAADPAVYDYRLFGYFLLMDEEWHRIRLQIGFDLANV